MRKSKTCRRLFTLVNSLPTPVLEPEQKTELLNQLRKLAAAVDDRERDAAYAVVAKIVQILAVPNSKPAKQSRKKP